MLVPRSPSLFALGAAPPFGYSAPIAAPKNRAGIPDIAVSIPLVPKSVIDNELDARQSALQAEAAVLLDELDRSKIFADFAPLEVMGSHISGPVIDDRV
jgi:hypothetical protein